jgi:hypothetical protein
MATTVCEVVHQVQPAEPDAVAVPTTPLWLQIAFPIFLFVAFLAACYIGVLLPL